MLNQTKSIDMVIMLEPFLSIMILIILMFVMIVVYMKMRVWVLICALFLVSIIMGIMSLNNENIPFNPYISLFFILFQLIFFILITLKVIRR